MYSWSYRTTYENLVALSRKRVDEFISENLPGFKIKQEALDADANENVFSMLSSFSEAVSYFMGKKVKMATIVKQLRKELLLRYEEFYKQFNNDILNILIELDAFLDDPLRYCNKDSINVFLVALGNAFQVNIVVYQSNEESCWKSDLLANVCNNGRTAANNDDNITFTSTLHFARTLSPHVYPILPGKYFKERQKNEHSVADENEILLQPCFKRNTIKETNVDESEYEVVFVKSVVEDNNSELPQKSCNELDEAGDKKENVVCVKKTEREERFCGITGSYFLCIVAFDRFPSSKVRFVEVKFRVGVRVRETIRVTTLPSKLGINPKANPKTRNLDFTEWNFSLHYWKQVDLESVGRIEIVVF